MLTCRSLVASFAGRRFPLRAYGECGPQRCVGVDSPTPGCSACSRTPVVTTLTAEIRSRLPKASLTPTDAGIQLLKELQDDEAQQAGHTRAA